MKYSKWQKFLNLTLILDIIGLITLILVSSRLQAKAEASLQEKKGQYALLSTHSGKLLAGLEKIPEFREYQQITAERQAVKDSIDSHDTIAAEPVEPWLVGTVILLPFLLGGRILLLSISPTRQRLISGSM